MPPASPRLLRGLTEKQLAILFTAVTVALSYVSLRLGWWGKVDLNALFVPEFLDSWGRFDSTGQRQAHRLMLVLVIALSLLGLWLMKQKANLLHSKYARLLSATLRNLTRPGPLLFFLTAAAALDPASRNRVLLAFLSLFLIVRFGKDVPPRLANGLLWALAVAGIGFYMLPALFLPISLVSYDAVFADHHLGIIIQGEELAAGLRLFDQVRPDYGLLFQTLLAFVIRYFGALEIGDYVRFIQWLQLCFALIALAAYRSWRPRSPWLWLAPLFLVLPWIHTFHGAIFFPNLSALRFMGFPLGFLLLMYIGKRSGTGTAYLLGFIAGWLLLINLETGIAMSLAFAAFILARHYSHKPFRIVLNWGLFLGGIATTMLVFGFVFKLAVGYFPIPATLSDVFSHMVRSSAGLAGLKFHRDVTALLILLHSLFVFFRGAMLWRKGPLSFRWAFRIAVATCILVWFAYYANTPLDAYIWSYLFLYGFLLLDLLSRRWFRWDGQRAGRLAWPVPVLLLGLVVIPQGISDNATALGDNVKELKIALGAKASPGLLDVSGIRLSAPYARFLIEKAAFLKAMGDQPDLMYFTTSPTFISHLSGVYPRHLPFTEAFRDVITPSDFRSMVRLIEERAPPIILFDDPDGLEYRTFNTTVPRKKYYQHLQRDLSGHYRPARTVSGWQIWERY